MHFFPFQAHVEARLAFATLHANDNWYNKVDVDEKWYFAWKAGGKLKVPPNEEAPRKFLKSKRHVPKVMFLAATARPRAIPQYGREGDPDFVPAQMFDGKIGIWRVSEPKIALKRSIYHEKDDVYEKDVTLNGDRYAAMIVEKVMLAIRKKMPWLVHECRAGHFNSEIVIQQDGATPHTGKGRPEVMTAAGRRHYPPICIETQPAQSPDCNINDLAFFSAHAAAFNKKQKFASLGDMETLVSNVKETYNAFPYETLERCWLMKSKVMGLIVEHGGKNDFKLPHYRDDE
jgi:hypothetical protein